MRCHRSTAFISSLILFASAALPSSASPQRASDKPSAESQVSPSLKVSTDLVVVLVLVRDAQGKPVDPTYAPIFDELNRRKAILFFHPTAPNCCRNLVPNVPAAFTEYPHDTTRAVTSLLFSGSLARFRDIRFIFSHAGGTIPMLAGRLAELSFLSGVGKKCQMESSTN